MWVQCVSKVLCMSCWWLCHNYIHQLFDLTCMIVYWPADEGGQLGMVCHLWPRLFTFEGCTRVFPKAAIEARSQHKDHKICKAKNEKEVKQTNGNTRCSFDSPFCCFFCRSVQRILVTGKGSREWVQKWHQEKKQVLKCDNKTTCFVVAC